MNHLNLQIQKRGSYRNKGIIIFVIATAVLIDSPFIVPIPVIGFFSVILASIIYFLSFYYIYHGIKLPRKEFLQFIYLKGKRIDKKEAFLFFKDEIDERSYQKMIRQLERSDYLSLPEHDMDFVESHAIIPENQLNLTDKGLEFLKLK